MSELAVNSIVDASSGNTVQINGMTPTGLSLQGFRNRLFNGNMVIDQRNNGASVTLNGNQFSVDRWGTQASQNSRATIQQSTTVPLGQGFQNSLVVTSSSAYSSLSTDFFWLYQTIEGFNIADLGWGTASAQPVTLRFWARSSLTGNFSVRLGSGSRSYVTTFAINAANTYEEKTVTIPGDTSGTWNSTNGSGIQLQFDLGSGSNRTTATVGAWQAGDFVKASGSVSLVATNGATLNITGVQLEAGAVATPFERRPFGAELALCQRYFERMGGTSYEQIGFGAGTSGTATRINIHFKTEKRASPTFTIIQGVIITPRVEYDTPVTGTEDVNINPRGMHARFDHANLGALYRPHFLLSDSNTPFGYLDFNAEL